MKKIILIGGGGHALSCIDVIEQEKKYKILGIIDKNKKIGEKILNYKIIGEDKDLKDLKKKADYAFVSLGQIGISEIRKNIFLNLQKLGFKLPTIISPKAYISKNLKINKGSIIHHGVIVNSGAEIGANCIINTNSLIEHNVKVGNHSHISTSVTLNGDVKIGDSSFIGSGTIIKNSVVIGTRVSISMGQKIFENVTDNKIIKK
jgi:sugar O-acyltransferase (sialic acid O-acetyltransferase NeuD family)